MERNHIQLYRNGENTNKPTSGNLEYGELAMTYLNQNEKLYLRSSTNAIVDFSSDHLIYSKVNTQDNKLCDAVGLSANTESSTDVTYTYIPSNSLLQNCKTMNDSVEYLAGQLNSCLTLINNLKQNAYMIETNFTVTPSGTTTEIVSYATKYNGSTTTPSTVVVTKVVNDDETNEKTIISTTKTSSYSTTSTIEGLKERFNIVVQPQLSGSSAIRNEMTQYVCYVGANANSLISSSDVANFTTYFSQGTSFDATVTTNNQYIHICVPESLSVVYVSSDGITVSILKNYEELGTSLGVLHCYRSLQLLTSNTWHLTIKHIN